MSLKTEMRIHGNAVEIEFPKKSLLAYRNARGSVFRETSEEKEEYWCHIPIPTPTILDGVRPTLKKIFIDYSVSRKDYAAVYIGEVHIFDGISHLNNEQPVWKAVNKDQKEWVINPPLTIRYGLGITVKVVFGAPHMDNPDRHIMFHAAGAEFETP